MNFAPLTRTVFGFVTAAILSLSFASSAGAGIIGTGEALSMQSRNDQVAQVSAFLARDDVRQRMTALGVSPELVEARLDRLTPSELAELSATLDTAVAGGDALGIIGAVFLVLLILEVVGATDFFKGV